MTVILRNKNKIARLGVSLRGYSTAAISLNEDLIHPYEQTTTTTSTSNSSSETNKYTVKSLLAHAPSTRIAKAYAKANEITLATQDKTAEIKNRLMKLDRDRDYDTLLSVLSTWANHDIHGMVKLLGRHQFASYVGKLMNHNAKSIIDNVAIYPILKLLDINQRRMKPSQRLCDERDAITNLYNRLLYTDKSASVYDEINSTDIYESSKLTGYRLIPQDYENLMKFEFKYLKLDLCSNWFMMFKKQYGPNYIQYMTPKMWSLVFPIYCDGNPRSWGAQQTKLANTSHDPKRSPFESPISFNELLREFNQAQIDKDVGIDFYTSLISSLGHSGKLDQLQKYVASLWAVDANGKYIPGLPKVEKYDPMYPTMELVTTLFLCFAYNGQFFEGLKYVDGFQKVYPDVNKFSLRSAEVTFWQMLFKWADISTRYEPDRALHFYLKQTKADIGSSGNENISLDEIQKNANFDYEGYLQFTQSLHVQRQRTFDEIWKYLQEAGIPFSKKIYTTYLNTLTELTDLKEVETKYYAFLTTLAKQYHFYHLSSDSFTSRTNLGFTSPSQESRNILILYEQTLKQLVGHKWKHLYIGQCKPLIDEWALDEEMKTGLNTWYQDDILPQYREYVEMMRSEAMNRLKAEEEEDSDSLLNLM